MTFKMLLRTLLRRKNTFSSTCLVRAWRMELWERETVL